MLIDARSVPSETIIESDICIIGAGAAGITLAREFIASDLRVTVLESGGMELEADTQALYEAEKTAPKFLGTLVSRLRYFGGTTNHWGGYCLPFDDIDFEARDDLPYHGWPFAKAHLDPFYARAQDVCQLGPYDYRPARWDRKPIKIPAPFDGPIFERKILQENPLRFGPIYVAALRQAPRVTVYLHANAVHLSASEAGSEVRELSVKTLSGVAFAVHARVYVLALGGIENARLLLASGREEGPGLGNEHDLVGRFLMTHLVYSGGTILPADPHMDFDYQANDPYVAGKYRIDRIFGLTAQTMRAQHLPNMLMFPVFKFAAVADTLKAVKRLTGGEGPGGSALADLSQVIGNLEGITEFAIRKTLFGEGVPVEAIQLACNSEQQPNPQSRISLGTKRDHLGMREIVVDWQTRDEERHQAATTVRLLGSEIGRTGFGRLKYPFGEEDAWPDDFVANEHHMGTTRMHADPALGVVDEQCRVHGIDNIYVAGSSVFPTSSASNPTLTIVALALRLADHLKAKF